MLILSTTFLRLLDLVEGELSPESEAAHDRLAYGGMSANYETWCILMTPIDNSAPWYDTTKDRKRRALNSLKESAHLFDKYPNVKREYEKARDRFEKDGR